MEKLRNEIFIVFFILLYSSFISAQDFNSKKFPDAYKNVYIWKEKENTASNLSREIISIQFHQEALIKQRR